MANVTGVASPVDASPVDRVLARLSDARRQGANGDGGRGWLARCPAHEDREPSLSVSSGNDGRVLLKCFAGCRPEAITAALGLTMAD
ncbi:MAG TPA: hypothetical protein VM490_20415, partial [Armatimonadaceae bacterium]|nr:hypothetical protein [Armatimonadaceae bacterium]